MKTELKDRILYFDGTNQVNPEHVPSLFLSGVEQEKIIVNYLNEDIQLFNNLSDYEIGAESKSVFDPDFSWKIPQEYLNLDLDSLIMQKASKLGHAYEHRAERELHEIKTRKLTDVFRALIYVVDVLKETNTLWGVGRGSSCASLVLFILGLHKVDPIRFNIPLEEFFHD